MSGRLAAIITEERGQFKTIFRPGKVRLEGIGLTRAGGGAEMLEPGDRRTSRRYALAVGRVESANTSFDRSDFLLWLCL